VGQKEKELHDMNEYRIHALECSVAERDRQVVLSLARALFLSHPIFVNPELKPSSPT